MTHFNRIHFTVIAMLACFPAAASAQSSIPPTPGEVAQVLGFSASEIRKIEGGEVIKKNLAEGSDKELAGVVAVFFRKPLGDLVDFVMQGKILETDKDLLGFRSWKPGESADEAFAALALSADEKSEAKLFVKASPGDKLNLSTADIAQFRNAQPTPDAVNVPLRG